MMLYIMMQMAEEVIPTILDYLNEDCWRAVLDYVPVKDIIRTERASRCWQRAVLRYLLRLRIGVRCHLSHLNNVCHNIRMITSWDIPEDSFKKWTCKLGSSIVAIYCVSEEMLKIISEYCPNIEAIIIYDPDEKISLKNRVRDFNNLQKLYFTSCDSISDQCVSEFIASNALVELEINCNKVTGQFLNNIDLSKLKSITLEECWSLESHHLSSAISRFSELTKLNLQCLPIKIYPVIPLLLDHLDKLESLSIIEYEFDLVDVDDYYTSICRLSNLKRLRLHVRSITDDNLASVTQSCVKLCSLDIDDLFRRLSARSLSTICLNVGTRLTELRFKQCSGLTDDDVLACIRACPNLMLLDVSNCPGLTTSLIALAAAARRETHALHRLLLFVFPQQYVGMDFEELIINRWRWRWEGLNKILDNKL